MDTMTNLGENFEYIRTIAKNKIELKKLDALEGVSNLVASVLLSIILFIMCSAFLTISLIGTTIWLAKSMGSYPIATAIVSFAIFILMLLVVFFRTHLIFRPIKKALYSSTLKA